MTIEDLKAEQDAQHQATQEDYNHLPSSFSVLTQQGKVKLLRNEENVQAFEHLYSLWQDPTHRTEDMEAAVKEYLATAPAESITVGDPR